MPSTTRAVARDRLQHLMSHTPTRTYTVADVQRKLHCGRDTATTTLLGMFNAGLIDRRRRNWRGRPYEYWWKQ